MSGLFSSKKAPAPPPIVAPQTFTDLINGVQVTNKDGQTVISQLPLTPEQQAQKDEINGILDKISNLSEGLAIDNPTFAPYVDAIRAQQAQVRGQAFGEATTALNNGLAKAGLQNGTAADVQRGLLAQQMNQQTQNDATSLYSDAETQRANLLTNQYNLLNTKNTLNQQNLQNLTGAGQTLLQGQQNEYNLDNQIQMQNYQAQLSAFNSQKPSLGSQLLNAGLTLGAAYLSGGGSLAASAAKGAVTGAVAGGVSNSAAYGSGGLTNTSLSWGAPSSVTNSVTKNY